MLDRHNLLTEILCTIERWISVFDAQKDNDAYHTLQAVSGLIDTGPTGTNVNDVAVALLHI